MDVGDVVESKRNNKDNEDLRCVTVSAYRGIITTLGCSTLVDNDSGKELARRDIVKAEQYQEALYSSSVSNPRQSRRGGHGTYPKVNGFSTLQFLKASLFKAGVRNSAFNLTVGK